MATGLSISLKPSSNSKNTRDRNTVLDIQQQGPKRDRGDAWMCVGSGDVRGGGRFHISRWRSASRESTSARGARQKVNEENSERRSCSGGGGDKGGDRSEDT